MDYWELRKEISKIIPRMTVLSNPKKKVGAVKEKGRKRNYSEFNLKSNEWVKQERLLNTQEINSFLEISVRAAACPMPMNVDVYDSLLCNFGCQYCVVGTTKISTPIGNIPIKDLKKGDEVHTYNEETKEIEVKKIMETMKRKSEIYKIKIGDTELKITGEHPVFTKRGWVTISELKEDDIILTIRK